LPAGSVKNRQCTFWRPPVVNATGRLELLAQLTPFNIGMLTSDDCEVPKGKHLTGKIFSQRIERYNLTLRTRIKRLAQKQSASHARLSFMKKSS